MLFEIISNGEQHRRSGMRSEEEKYIQKTLILAFEVIVQPLVHTFFSCTLFLYLAHSELYLLHSALKNAKIAQ